MKRIAFAIILLAPAPAFAEAGMPQLDPQWWPGQVLWLAISFIFMYAVSSLFLLPAIAGTLETRRTRIAADIAAGQRMRDEAMAAQTGYEASLQRARAEASAIMSEVHNAMKAKAEAEAQAFRATMDSDIAALETRLDAARQKAMGDMQTLIAGIARDAAVKITGMNFDEAQARDAVESVNRREAA